MQEKLEKIFPRSISQVKIFEIAIPFFQAGAENHIFDEIHSFCW